VSTKARPKKPGNASDADKNRARRFRRRAEGNGSPLRDDEKEWLDGYTKTHTYRGSRAPVPPPPTSTAAAAAKLSWDDVDELEEDDDQEEEAETIEEKPPAASSSSTKPRAVLDFGKDEEHAGGELASKCPPNCPRCRALDGSYVCATTGLRVWPPISVESSMSAASLILGTIALSVAWGTKQMPVVPSEDEIRSMAAAVRVTATRRFPMAGRWDDLLAIGWCFYAFTRRAFRGAKKPPMSAEDSVGVLRTKLAELEQQLASARARPAAAPAPAAAPTSSQAPSTTPAPPARNEAASEAYVPPSEVPSFAVH
jgi:hypothetical protein